MNFTIYSHVIFQEYHLHEFPKILQISALEQHIYVR